MPELSLKKQNLRTLHVFFSLNILILFLVYLHYPIHLSNLQSLFDKYLSPSGIIATLIYFAILFLDGFIPSNIKGALVYWKIKNALPGHRIFSRIARNDSRIDLNRIQTLWGSSPSDEVQQNMLWYKIYQKNIGNIIVQSSHKDFLLFREITTISFFFLCFHWMLYYFSGINIVMIRFYSLFLLVQYLVSMVGARNYGNRFVCNVLAIESTK